jgi:phosphohistidine phosphatase
LKELLLLRHAKSDWDDPEQDDFDRPLAKRGRRAAPEIGAWLARQGWRPELVLCSAAKRTRETWSLVAEALGGAPAVRFERRLYLAEPESLARRVARIDDGVRRAMVIGHNPGIARYALMLASAGGAATRRMRAKFPTGAAAWFALDADDWRGGASRPARLLAYVTPADLADG